MQGWRGAWLSMLLVCCGSAPGHAVAASPEVPRFQTIGVAEGLPSTYLTAIAEGADGYLWIGTRDGLARYDGNEFRIFRHDPADPGSLRDNSITALHVDAKGTLWIAGENHGISNLTVGSAKFHHFDNSAARVAGVFAMASTADGAVWFGTYTNGLHRLEATGKWSRFSSDTRGLPGNLPSSEVLALLVGADGALWVGTGSGLLRHTGLGFKEVLLTNTPSPRVFALAIDVDGDVLVGTNQGLFEIEDGGDAVVPAWTATLPDQVVVGILVDREGTKWLATPTGLVRERNQQIDLPSGSFSGHYYGVGMVEDREGSLWIGRQGLGLMHLPQGWRNFAVYSPGQDARSTSSNFVRGLAAAKGGAWIVGVGGGLDQFDLDTRTVARVLPAEKLRNCRGMSVGERMDGSVWIGCPEALFRFEPENGALGNWGTGTATDALPSGTVEHLAVTPDGLLWSYSFGGGLQARDNYGRVVHEQSDPSSVELLAPGPDGQLWVAGELGLRHWIDSTRRLERVTGAPTGEVFGFAFDGPDRVWLHQLGVLEQYEWRSGALHLLRRIFATNGLPAVESGGMFVDAAHRVWLTTARGLLRFDPKHGRFRMFGMADGLPSHEFLGQPPLMLEDGTVLAITSAGLVHFSPDAIEDSGSAPVVAIESLSLRRDDAVLSLPTTDRIVELRPGDRDLRVTARIVSLSNASSRHFRFRLQGYDNDWIDDAEGERVFTRLEHGTYALEVIGADAEGLWSAPVRIEVVVLPAWWQTTWARFGFAMLVILVVVAAAKAYRNHLRRQHDERLREERRIAVERASEAKSRFLADLGHEIRTPMTGVLGMAELLQGDVTEPRQLARVDAIRSAGQHLMRLVNDALDIARIEAGRLELLDVPVELRALVDDVGALLRPQADAKGLALALSIGVQVPRGVRGDPVRLRQVLLNLGHNAIKFTPAGTVALHVAAHEGRLRIDVIDSGCGLDAEQQARLFQRFEQPVAAPRDANHPAGAGLGLAICRELVRAMGGDLAVASTPGEGARFTLSMPLREALLPEPFTPSRHVREPSAHEGFVVLVVEDDPIVAEVVRDLLAVQGHDVDHAPHALAALAAAQEREYDLVLVDLDLPGMDGFAFARLWHAQGLHAPLVALTARADAHAEPDARAAGMRDFVRKPVGGEALAEVVARHARIRVPATAAGVEPAHDAA